MIRRHAEFIEEPKQNIRGGLGTGRSVELLKNGDMAHILSLGRTTLEPGASIGEHAHPNTEDLYLILEGRGTGILNGERFPVEAGDLFLVKAGGDHGLINDSDSPLTFLGVLTREAGSL
ncbi:cupin domain-containing protein [Geothrix sp. PMB-07]|uniref:cupin domain-containing protein n=1 Tax=Geothrix sp. PMB-07 TaxID=3068640 RepID=UPI002741D26A|nr:cupin domain-containing protein [Geothrix sp. PMB-07]WLT32106.1 cupin domain-containing protein [Geothrix sp. PMB-07]